MRRRIKLIVGMLLLAGCGQTQEDLSYTEHKTYPKFKHYCGVCHSYKRPLSRRFDEKGWREVVSIMRNRSEGLIPEQDAEEIIRFLSETRGL